MVKFYLAHGLSFEVMPYKVAICDFYPFAYDTSLFGLFRIFFFFFDECRKSVITAHTMT